MSWKIADWPTSASSSATFFTWANSGGVQKSSWRKTVEPFGQDEDAPRAVLEKLAAVQMIDVPLPTTDGREMVMARHTQPEKDLQLLLDQLRLELPEQGPPKIQAQQPALEPVVR